MTPLRRRLLAALSAFPFLAATRGHAAVATPAQTEGPFYPSERMRRADQDNDLVRVASAVREAGGEIIRLQGRVHGGDGRPLAGARVEIWQVDANGRYLHTGDRGGGTRDEGFQGFGHAITDADGVFAFRTIKPVAYPGRTPHIHAKVFDATGELLTTQFYIDGHPQNEGDRLWRSLSPEERQAVAMRFEEAGGLPTASVSIRL